MAKVQTIKQDLPLETWKQVFVNVNGTVSSAVWIEPVDLSESGVKAKCRNIPDHKPPQDGCDCGFWSYVEKPAMPGAWIASIAVAGKVEVGEGKARAEWQRVLALYAPDACLWRNDTSSNVCGQPSTEYATDVNGYVTAVCSRHATRFPELVDLQSFQELISVPIVWPIPKPTVLRPNPSYNKQSDKVAEGEGWNAVGLPIEFMQCIQQGFVNWIQFPYSNVGGFPQDLRLQVTAGDKAIHLEFMLNGQYTHRCTIYATRSILDRR